MFIYIYIYIYALDFMKTSMQVLILVKFLYQLKKKRGKWYIKKKNPLNNLYETFIKKKSMYSKIVGLIDNLMNK